MYSLVETDKPIRLKGGTWTQPKATLMDEYGGVSHIIEDDYCLVLVNGSINSDYFTPVQHWYPEAVEALKSL